MRFRIFLLALIALPLSVIAAVYASPFLSLVPLSLLSGYVIGWDTRGPQ
jgi:hypothetical protein